MTEVKIPLDTREIVMLKDYAESRRTRTHWDYYGWLDEVHSVLDSLSRAVTEPDFDDPNQVETDTPEGTKG